MNEGGYQSLNVQPMLSLHVLAAELTNSYWWFSLHCILKFILGILISCFSK